MTDASATPQGRDQARLPAIRVVGQYVKDLSFENPGAPDSLRAAGQPTIDLAVDVQAHAMDENLFEVSLVISARATRENKPVFIVELTYTGLFQIQNVDAAARDAFLLIECPRLIFPFARRILSDSTRDGGFPPLMLEPVDFAALYRQQMAKRQTRNGQNGKGAPPAPPVES